MKLPEYVHSFMRTFHDNSFKIYIVGGAVRNMLLNIETSNWDFTTSATPEEILAMFPNAFYHNTYGTVTIPSTVDESTILLEVTPFRKESGYTDARHPENIEWASTLDEDLARRDFTINALAFDGNQIIDIFDGQKHLEERQIVAVGDPDIRFHEDALRLMRAVRLSAELGFLIEERTKKSIAYNASRILLISYERIRDEFLKLLASDHPAEGIMFMKQTGLLKHILPELDVCFDIPQKSPKRHHIYDAGTHMVMSLKYCPSADPITRFATLIHDIGKAKTYYKHPKTELITFHNHEVVGTTMATEIAKRFKLSNKQQEKLVRLVQFHQFTVSEDLTDKAIRRFIRQVGLEYIQDMLDLRTGDRLGGGAPATSWRYELFKKRIPEVQEIPFSVKDLKVNGKDVMDVLAITPGRKIGKILDALFEKVENEEIPNERDQLLTEIKSIDENLS